MLNDLPFKRLYQPAQHSMHSVILPSSPKTLVTMTLHILIAAVGSRLMAENGEVPQGPLSETF